MTFVPQNKVWDLSAVTLNFFFISEEETVREVFVTGMLSPVSMLSSTMQVPEIIEVLSYGHVYGGTLK